MKKIKNLFKKLFENVDHPSNYLVYISLLIVYGFVLYKVFFGHWLYSVSFVFFLLIILLYRLFYNLKFLKESTGNGIIYGGRGHGKGILLQKKANSLKKVFSNVPMGDNTEIINPIEYIQSIGNNTIVDSINGTIKIVKKIEKFEGVNVLLDDITLYFPNFEDKLLKELYPSMPLTLAINRHLYNSYLIISVQDLERPYKILRELQTDFYIKALGTKGFGWFHNSIPFFRKFVKVKYIYYENLNSALEGILPWQPMGAIQEGSKKLYMSSGQATKEQFKSKYGEIKYGKVYISKNRLYYDTRYFHEVFFGYKAKYR